MIDSLNKYIDKTKIMLQLLAKPLNNEQRENAINRITQLIDDREALTKDIKPPFSSEEQELGKQAIELDQQLNHELTKVFQHIKKDMRNAKKQSRSNHSYLNPYKNVASFDGRFLDSKK
ncbi:hypothetical protein [Gracilibacillus thailandensis]|jgi:flagellar protein FliT|uniref:Flagellar protein FliT n=1 Tax=Gracilibacillus thailandensis TaxID=563735 RepID=A0A6N7QY09_9BACI|nr:hypothetical protein [Gracilibacillus thailandensis]MRI67053.1 hypothetical protein [Gracilibacillus thailandensis]